MTNKNEQRKVPELRFPEFSGEWKEKSWGDLGEYKKSYSYSRAYEGSGKLRHIHYGDIHTKLGPDINNKDELNSINIDGDHELVRFGDLVIADASEDYKDLGKVTRVNIDDSNIISGLHTHLFRVSNEIDSRFLLYYSKTLKYQKLIRRYGTGVSVLGLSKLNLNKFDVNLPNIMEQQKIGEFFSKLDRQIELEEKKLALLEEQKKGYMQKIFSQELRFKDENGEEYPEWEKKKLSEVAEYSNGLAHEEYVNESGNFTLINSKFISTDGKTKKEVTKSLLTANEGDIAMVLSDLPNGKALGKCYFVMEDKKYAINQRIALLKVKKGDSFFIYQILNRNKKLLKYDNGVSQTNLRKDNVLNLTINIPVISEQNKIAKIFSKFDERISYQQNKINYLIKNKKNLINKMLV